MRNPPFGEANMGALVGAVVGATGCLFAIGAGPAIVSRNLATLFNAPMVGLALAAAPASKFTAVRVRVAPTPTTATAAKISVLRIKCLPLEESASCSKKAG